MKRIKVSSPLSISSSLSHRRSTRAWLSCRFFNVKTLTTSIVLLLITWMEVYAQDGNAGINEATQRVRSYFMTGTNLMYAIGAVLGLVGAVKVYQKWNSGDPDTSKVAAAWFGSCVFLVIVATVLQSFFGV